MVVIRFPLPDRYAVAASSSTILSQAAAWAIVTCPRWPLRVAVIGILPAVNRLSGREAFAENN